MLQQDVAEDYVIATGQQHSVKEFVETACAYAGGMKIEWDGEGKNEVGLINGRVAIVVDPRYYRPAEVDTLLGDASKAKKQLGWEPKIGFFQLVEEMVRADFNHQCNLTKHR